MTESATKRQDGSKQRTSAMRQMSSRQRTLYTIAAIALLVAAIALSAGSEGGTGWLGLGDGDDASSSEATAPAGTSGTARTSTEETESSSAGDPAGDDDDDAPGTGDDPSGETTDPDPDADPDADDDISRAAVSQIDIPDFELPQTYEAEVAVVGWASSSAGTVYLDVRDATLLGPIDHMTGQEIEPADPAQDLSVRFEELTILATTSEGVRGALEAGDPVRVRLILIPSGDGAVFRVDRLAG